MTLACSRCASINPLMHLIPVGHGRVLCASCWIRDDRRAGTWAGTPTVIEGFVVVDLPRQALGHFRATDRERREGP
jgi:hypothetical protein